MRPITGIGVLAAILLGPATSAAGTITFNGTTTSFTTFQTPYSEAGYTLTPTATVSLGDMWFFDQTFNAIATFDGDYLEFDDFGNTDGFTLTRTAGGLFDLVSVMVSAFSTAGNFVFTGNLSGGGTITTTVQAGIPGSTASFSGFTSLTSLTVTSTDSTLPAMDNLTLREVEVVPEPATLSLLGLGLAGAVVRRWRRTFS